MTSSPGRFPKIGTLMNTAKVEVLAFTAFTPAHWPKPLIHESLGASQQGNQTPGPGGRQLPQRRGREPPRSHNWPALTRELPPVEVAKALDLGKADIFDQASELGRGIDAESERDGAARSVGRGQHVLGLNLAGLGGAESG